MLAVNTSEHCKLQAVLLTYPITYYTLYGIFFPFVEKKLLFSAGGYRGHGAGAEQAGPGGRGRVPLHRPERRPVTRQQEDHGPRTL